MKITLKSKMEKKSFLALSLMMLVAASVNAQVIIGSVTDAPHAGAILDLKSANKGMLLPNVALYDAETLTVGNSIADEDQSAVGMVVFNTNAYALDGTGVYVWDGTKWNGINVSGKEIIPTISTCHSNYYEPDATKYVDIKVRNTLGSTSDSLTMRFLTYNLGANPNIAGDNATPAEIAK
ncbi:MAG: hypothetical protein LBS25_07320, partial [Candidatus Symbiothrix sp.]|nr:hypothetical protein [Candidatus Symbiothrix sp.]